MIATTLRNPLACRSTPDPACLEVNQAQASTQYRVLNHRECAFSSDPVGLSDLTDLSEHFYGNIQRAFGCFQAYQDHYHFRATDPLKNLLLNPELVSNRLGVDASIQMISETFKRRLQRHLAHEKALQTWKENACYVRYRLFLKERAIAGPKAEALHLKAGSRSLKTKQSNVL